MYFQDILQEIVSDLMDYNLSQLKSSTFTETYRWVLVTWGFLPTYFQPSVGLFFPRIPDRQLNLGHMCFSLQTSSIKMVNVDEVRAYLSSLNTMDVIWLGNRLGDQKAK